VSNVVIQRCDVQTGAAAPPTVRLAGLSKGLCGLGTCCGRAHIVFSPALMHDYGVELAAPESYWSNDFAVCCSGTGCCQRAGRSVS